MKKFLFFLSISAALAAGCAKESITLKSSNKDFNAVSESTKTVLDATSVKWLSTDKIGIFAEAGSPACFVVSELKDNGSSAIFTGTCLDSDIYYALYPYSESSSLTAEGKIVSSIPANQTFTSSSFSDGASLAVAKSTGSQLQFKNIGAILAFTLAAEDIASVTFSADAPVAGGEATIDYNEGNPIVSVSGGSNSVVLSGDFVKGTTYYFAVYPGTYSSFSLTFTTSTGKTTTFNSTEGAVLGRNDNVKLDDFNLVLTPSINVKGTSTYAGSTEGITFSTPDLGTDAEYSWTFAGGTPATSTEREVTVNYATKGQYGVTLSVKKGAKSGSITKEKFISVYPDKPLLFLPFDGDYEDHSENGIEVTRVDGPSATEYLGLTQAGHTGIAGSSAYFPGFNNTKYSVLRITDDTFASKFNSSGNYTISFWFKGRSTKTGSQTLFSQGTGDAATGWHYMRIDNDGTAGAGQKYRLMYQLKYSNAVDDDCSIQYKYNYNGDGKTSHTGVTADLRDGKWHNICVRVMVENSDKYEVGGKAMSWKLYIDGQGPINNNAQKVKTLSSYIPFVIGAKDTGGALGDPVQGNIDDFIIWNRTIGNDEMASFSKY